MTAHNLVIGKSWAVIEAVKQLANWTQNSSLERVPLWRSRSLEIVLPIKEHSGSALKTEELKDTSPQERFRMLWAVAGCFVMPLPTGCVSKPVGAIAECCKSDRPRALRLRLLSCP